MDRPVIDTPDQADPVWVTDALRGSGLDVEVGAVAVSPVGTGQMAASFRLDLTYVAGDGPASVVVKLPAQDEIGRAAGASGGYAAEVRFYTEVASTVSIQVPHCHHVAQAAEGAQFTLVLEDLAPGAQGDQIAGCSVDQAHAAAVNLAGLHGPRWNDEGVKQYGSSVGDPAAIEFLSALLLDDTEAFIERYGGRIASAHIPILRRHAETVGAWLAAGQDVVTLVHGDYRLDNLLFATDAGGYPCATVDWQTLGHGNPLRDLAYFLGNGLVPELRREHERDLVAAYHDALRGFGVEGYSLDACWEHYRLGQFQGPFISILGAMHAARTDRGDDMFMAMIERACTAIEDLDSFAVL